MDKTKPAPVEMDKCSNGVAEYFADIIVAAIQSIPIKYLYAFSDKFASQINAQIIISALEKLPDLVKKKLKRD